MVFCALILASLWGTTRISGIQADNIADFASQQKNLQLNIVQGTPLPSVEYPSEAQNDVLTHDKGSTRGIVLAMLIEADIDANRADKIIHCESSWNPNAVGDYGNSYGLWQIHLPAHPSVTIECATDPICSTKYAIGLYKRKEWQPWTCYKLI